MLILGLIILVAAGVVGTVAVVDNRGASHQIPGGFHAFGRVMHGSSGQLFFWGAVVGAAAMLGLVLLLAGVRRDLQLRAQARRDGVRGARRTRRLSSRRDRDVVADDDLRDEDTRPVPETTREREREHQREAESVSSDGADGDVAVQS